MLTNKEELLTVCLPTEKGMNMFTNKGENDCMFPNRGKYCMFANRGMTVSLPTKIAVCLTTEGMTVSLTTKTVNGCLPTETGTVRFPTARD